MEASDFNTVTNLPRGHMLIGEVEVMLVNDQVAQRKARGHWET